MATSRTRRRTIGTIVSLLVLAGIVSTAGQVGSNAPAAARTLLRAYKTTVDQRSVHFTVIESISDDLDGFKQVSTTRSRGSTDFISGNGEETSTAGGLALEERAVSGVLYTRLPQTLLSGVSGRKPWLSVGPNKLDRGATGLDRSPLTDAGPLLAQSLSYLESGATKVIAVGPAPIRGVPTTEYETVDASSTSTQIFNVFNISGPSTSRGLSIDTALPPRPTPSATTSPTNIVPEASAAPPGDTAVPTGTRSQSLTVSIRAWVDAENRIRQLRMVMSLSTQTTISTTIDYYDFGVPVIVTAPPRNQVDDVTSKLIISS